MLLSLLVPAAGGRSALSYLLLLERVPGSTTLYLTLTNKGAEPIGLVALRGVDFPITGANAVGGGPAVCLVSGNPATVTCRNFQLQQGKTLTVVIATTGTATHALEAVTNGAEPRDIDFFPIDVQPARPRGTATIKSKGRALTVVGTNTGFVPFTRVVLVMKKAHVVQKIVSFTITKRNLAGARKPRCKVEVTSTPKDLVACNGRIDPGAAFHLALLVYVRGGAPGSKIAESLIAYDSQGQPATLEVKR